VVNVKQEHAWGESFEYKEYVKIQNQKLLDLLKARKNEAFFRYLHGVKLEAAKRFAVPPSILFRDLDFSSNLPTWKDYFGLVGFLLNKKGGIFWQSLGSDRLRRRAAKLLRYNDKLTVDKGSGERSVEASEKCNLSTAMSCGCSTALHSKPPVTLVVLSYRRPHALYRTIQSLKETLEGSNTEIIVVDNSSTPATRVLIEDAMAAKVVSGAVFCSNNIGISAGYNLGFALAREGTEYFTKIDHDQVILTHGWMDQVTGMLSRHPNLGIASLDQVNHPMLRVLPVSIIGKYLAKSWWLWTCGSTMTMSRDVRMNIVGDFLETDIKYFPDDTDYAIRARIAGLDPHYLVRSCSYHIVKDRRGWSKRSRQENEEVSKWGDTLAMLEDDYYLGKRPIFVKYKRYEDIRFPKDSRTLLIENDFI